MKLGLLPAGEGDALWLTWGPASDRRKLLVDLGVRATGKAFVERINALPANARQFELLVVTHVDTDHIYGILNGLVEQQLQGLTFGDVWFNGWTHLGGGTVGAQRTQTRGDVLGTSDLESYGGVQGEQFSSWLQGQPWNVAFSGGPVVRPNDTLGPSRPLAHGLRITVLGPTAARLTELAPRWRKDVAAALAKGSLSPQEVTPELAGGDLEPFGRTTADPELESLEDLTTLADSDAMLDRAPANGSSIALLIEHGEKRVVLAGDAFGPDLATALALLDRGKPVTLAAFKVPHHGSQANVTTPLVQSVHCGKWLFSTNGIKHNHPDPAAVARVLRYSSPSRPKLYFNEPSTFNEWWKNPTWRERFEYEAEYGNSEDGLEVDL